MRTNPLLRIHAGHRVATAAVRARRRAAAGAKHAPTMAQFMSAAFPHGAGGGERRPTASPGSPTTRACATSTPRRRPTSGPCASRPIMKDDGVDTTQLSISDDGSTVMFTRGAHEEPRRLGGEPRSGPERRRARDLGGEDHRARRRRGGWPKAATACSRPTAVTSPTRRTARSSACRRRRVRERPTSTRGSSPTSGSGARNSNPVWSPNGRKLAFVSRRTDHSFIAVYDVATRKVTYISPSVDFDTSPAWSADGKRDRIHPPARAHRSRSSRSPASAASAIRPGPAFNAGRLAQAAARGATWRWTVDRVVAAAAAIRPRAGAHAAGAASRPDDARPSAGGYNLSFWVADAATGDAQEFWHNAPQDKSLQRHQRDHVARRSRHLPARARGVDALLLRAGARARTARCTTPGPTTAPMSSVP